jgi:hypothetical protein
MGMAKTLGLESLAFSCLEVGEGRRGRRRNSWDVKLSRRENRGKDRPFFFCLTSRYNPLSYFFPFVANQETYFLLEKKQFQFYNFLVLLELLHLFNVVIQI